MWRKAFISGIAAAGLAGILAGVGLAGSTTASALAVGLVDEQGPAPGGYAGPVRMVDAGDSWASIEPAPGRFNWSVVDSELQAAQQAGMHVKLRMMTGVESPAWVEAQAGSFQIHGITPCCLATVYTVPDFWTPTYLRDYQSFMQAAAARYDGNPVIADVNTAGCTMQYGEPYLRDVSNRLNVAALLHAGFSTAADATCHLAEMHDLGDFWKHSQIELSFNPYQEISPTGQVHISVALTEADMATFRALYGRRASLENNSLANTGDTSGNYGSLYATMRAMGAPIAFQAKGASNFGPPALALAVAEGADNVELPYNFRSLFTPGQLASFAALLARNAP